ncbi:MAG TPA: thiamine phosphate synthase [Methylovirgula sp.]|nr:thiamine phosphate synthase [Methylovirgula sp.]
MDAPRLYLITPKIVDPGFVAPFEAAIAAGEIACAWLRGVAADLVRTLADIAQARGVACLVDDPKLAAEMDLDGVHIEGIGARFDAALAAMKPGRIVGIGGLETRHEAMLAGEAGADYLMFDAPSLAETCERIAWWAEIFNIPCIGEAARLEDIGALVNAGADFIALCDAVWADAQGPASAVEAARRALAAHEPAA